MKGGAGVPEQRAVAREPRLQLPRPRARRTRLEGTLGPLETDLRLLRDCLHQFKHLEGGLARTLQRRAILDYPIRWGGWASSGWNP